ncbi:MAG: membrane dipeptidase [Chloroflexota bacterium]
MILVDAHQDIAYNAFAFNRDYTLPAYKKRRLEPYTDPRTGPGRPTLGLPDSLLGRVAVAFATIFVAPAGGGLFADGVEPVYADARQASTHGLRQLDFYERLTGEHEQVRIIHSARDLDEVLATWADGTPYAQRTQGLILLMEGADPIREPKQFEEWYERGVRAVGPAWSNGTRYAAGNREDGPLTSYGFELLEVLADARAVLDTSHLAEQAFFHAVERYEGPIIASHSNPRRFRESMRNLSDRQIQMLAERDGVMGIVTYNLFLNKTWRAGEGRLPFTIVLDAIDHVCQITGSAAHVGIGSDLDGGFGVESVPHGIETSGDLWWITTGLRKRGYTEADIEAIAGGNFLRKLRESLPGS